MKIYVYGYRNRRQSSRRLERETRRNVELMWLTGRLTPDFKTIADFRKDNGPAIRRVCREFIVLCRRLNLFSEAIVAIDGSKFKAVNNRDRNFTANKLKKRMAQLEESIGRYLAELDRADREPAPVTEGRVSRLKRWEHEAVLEAMQARLDQQPDAMRLRRQTVEHPFGTLKAWMGATHFLTKRLPRVSTEMSLHVLAYNLKRVMQILGIVPLMQAMRA